MLEHPRGSMLLICPQDIPETKGTQILFTKSLCGILLVVQFLRICRNCVSIACQRRALFRGNNRH